MNKTIQKIITFAFILMMNASWASAATFMPDPIPAVENEMAQIQISITNGSTLHVKNADGQVLEIYNITGVKVFTQRIDSPSRSYELSNQPRGWYLVKIGDFTRKIYLK